MHIKIVIDTTNNQQIKAGLIIDEKEYIIDQAITPQRTQVILPIIEKMLKQQNRSFTDITEVQVNQGPGSFTGIRVGITIANTLGFLLKVPVNGLTLGELAEPVY